MYKFLEIFDTLVVKTLKETNEFIKEFGPKITLSLIILATGWICAALLRKVISKLLKALGTDILSEKIGVKRFLKKGGVARDFSSLTGLVFYWIVIFSTLVMAFNTLGLEVASQLIGQSLSYIPKIIAGLVLLTLGLFLSKFIAHIVRTSARLANVPFYTILGKITRFATIAVVLIIVLEYLGAPGDAVFRYGSNFFIAVFSTMCLIILVGGRDVASNVLAGRFVKERYRIGDVLEFDSICGKIDSIDIISTTLINDKGEKIIIPNSELVVKIIRKKDRSD